MSVIYKVYQVNRTNFKNTGKWYGRAYHLGIIDTKELADIIQQNVSVKKSDVYAVLMELANVVRDKLLASYKVRIEGLGLFSVGLRTKCADTAKAFFASSNINGERINFMPASARDSVTKKRTVALLNGIKVQSATEYSLPKTEQTNP
jgi:predicted histone-like DNA-binding protein